jgi:hypothetical protein
VGRSVTSATPISPARTEFRTPLGPRLLSLVAILVLAAATVFQLVVGLLLLVNGQWLVVALVALACACLMAALTDYVGRDLRGKWGLRVALEPNALVLDLPRGRSLIHRPPAQHLTVPYDEIEAIETRLEGYPTLGMEIVQRAYVLRRKSGDLIFLFEDRALATGFESHMFSKLAAGIAARAHVPARDLGMVEGRGGALAVWGTHAPDWAAPPLPLALQLRIWRRAALTGKLAIGIVIFAVVLRGAIALF